ncbi:acetyl-CoA carboxylase biotin carboxyl carrier protein [Idiomarina loihiensis]|jgi:acetyl-CoA carboxylase biotin carboxyl carrier protein|uniref:Biotin carboxyl carrier protein of acetyl-CoA carboxylase n=1 Tax=Idiomarina loihiensis (strain ATCC BAA-735 / DSM 15497 / L2-TR) TaxID=283942 RepID=Q5QVU1_IDILO|nr:MULTISPECIES: acetyl-CoA carboxylase biotin carboxyl carrier protein [Idiomarina]NWO03657.1 acetyl-CoA carboxylase biotin carboxyl carrier protein [Idiomarinaceae bacterium]AAV83117.1 Acetyl-CoA carboxylase, biotin carboxyl carrier protein [Idiomarina loihiensis L2TR]AGM37162.1 acetyl-CoA carboxylase biotin carboxyl carrier protein [Idiomarina loihiensis GSL 199]MAA61981.1 acetyl-CoA carboxylase, biotin carboxyl carrier protein [Idiomarina sp.]MRJ45555.1 acetyl-CoA carboxylase biotin carbox|tara:strand:+ start:10190 stop:10645 length:456 start_codon:yes stop_codon:yes gene_type:complete
MDIRKIKKLIELVEESGVAELEITEGEESVRINRYSAQPAPMQYAPQPQHAPQQAPQSAPASQPAAEPASEEISGHVVRSPMVGTFYEAPSPDAKPFVTVGSRVNAGETLCIIEAMKMMNQIEADKSGVVKQILVDNEEPVEFDQPLFIIE